MNQRQFKVVIRNSKIKAAWNSCIIHVVRTAVLLSAHKDTITLFEYSISKRYDARISSEYFLLIRLQCSYNNLYFKI